MTSHWPSRWNESRLKYESTLKGRLGWQGLTADEYRDEGPYVVSSAHFLAEKVQWDQCPRVSDERYRLDANIQLQPFDILLMKDGAALGKLAYVGSLPGLACLNSHLLLLRPRGRAYQPKYLFYVATTRIFQDYMQVYGTGATFMGVSQRDIGNFPLALPSFDEQTQIAKFLDYETAKIDALIEKQRQLIALLKEKRQAVISHAVTKGLNPNAPLRDSGVEWLGEVPAHWTVAKLCHRYEVQLGKMLDHSRITGENLFPYLRVFDVQWGDINIADLPQMDFDSREQVKYRLKQGDLLVNEGGSYVGRSAIWQGELETCYYQKALHRLRPIGKDDTTQFLFYVMLLAANSGVFVAGGNQTTIDHLTAAQLNAYRFPFPPIREQKQIANDLDEKCLRFNELILMADGAVVLLQERRAALISSAVTGKIDVRNWKPPESKPQTEAA